MPPPPPDGPPAPILTGIVLNGPESVEEQTSAEYVCNGKYSDGTTEAINATWSENSAYTSIDSTGLLTADDVSADETVTVTATYGGYSVSMDIVVQYVAPTITDIEITGPSSLDEDTTAQYSCTANWSDGSTTTVAPTWSENSSYSSISSVGLLNADSVSSDQSVTITASYAGLSATYAVTISDVPPTLTGISISGPASLDEETSAQYSCTASWSDGSTTTVIPTWSENSAYASIGAAGVLSAYEVDANRSVTLTASYGGRVDTHSVTILDLTPALEYITISGPDSMEENSTESFTCTAHYADGTSAEVNPTWTENAGFAYIDAAGMLSVGNIEQDFSVTVSATYDGLTASHTVTALMVGTQVIIPLSGFEGKNVWARLWDENAQEWYDLGEMVNPSELVIEGVEPGGWYWVTIKEYDDLNEAWIKVYSAWINL